MSTDTPISQTKRICSEGMEKHIDVYHPILNVGHLSVKDYMGDDSSVLHMARMSYGRGTKGVSDDRSLLRYLMSHHHDSPFEGCVVKLHLKMPIFVLRQWIRHRASSANEYSARYSILPDEFYIPELDQLAIQSKDNKQGRGSSLDPERAREVLEMIVSDAERNFRTYHKLLNVDEDGNTINPDQDGIARELARMGLPLSTYTELYWQTNLRMLLHFLKLRMDSHAQYEIRVYANKMYEILCDWVPMTAEAFRDYALEARTFSRMEMDLLKSMMESLLTRTNSRISLEKADAEKHGLSMRELREFCATMNIPLE